MIEYPPRDTEFRPSRFLECSDFLIEEPKPLPGASWPCETLERTTGGTFDLGTFERVLTLAFQPSDERDAQSPFARMRLRQISIFVARIPFKNQTPRLKPRHSTSNISFCCCLTSKAIQELVKYGDSNNPGKLQSENSSEGRAARCNRPPIAT